MTFKTGDRVMMRQDGDNGHVPAGATGTVHRFLPEFDIVEVVFDRPFWVEKFGNVDRFSVYPTMLARI